MPTDRMNQVTLLSRVLIALIFILAGVGKIMDFAGTSAYIASKGLPMSDIVTVLTIALELGGGLALAVGWRTKMASYALALFTLLAALIFHNFWSKTGAAAQQDMIHFLKNLAIIGGLLLFATYGAGTYSCDSKCAIKPDTAA